MSFSATSSLSGRKIVPTRFGEIAYQESGSGPPALFLHGLFLNGDIWLHQLEDLADRRRCIAVDLLAHGASAVPRDEPLTISLQAEMVVAFLDALHISSVDLVGNDSGGAIAQIIATKFTDRVRSLTLTNCDTHDNWPPDAFAQIHELAEQGLLAQSLGALAADPNAARSVLQLSFEDPHTIPDATIESFFGPFARSNKRAEAVQDYVTGMENSVTVAIRDDLARLFVPTLIVWGADDAYFDVSWSRWLAETIPGTITRIEVPGGRLFHPFERPEILNQELRELWAYRDAHASLTEYLDAWNRHDLKRVISWHSEDTVFAMHTGAVTHSGRDSVLDAFRSDLVTWPDVHWAPIRRAVTTRLWVLETVMTATASQAVDVLGFSVSRGDVVRGHCVDLLTIDSGKVTRKDTYLDVIEVLSSAQPTR